MRYQVRGGLLRIGAQVRVRLQSPQRRPEQDDLELAI